MKGKSPKKLGRARVSGDSKLDEVFKKDYRAREVFAFLNVHTLKELEHYEAQEIVDLLTAPMVQTVERIRKGLALLNRSLENDSDYAVAFLQEITSPH